MEVDAMFKPSAKVLKFGKNAKTKTTGKKSMGIFFSSSY
jgi:hypothetical protein